MAPGTDPATNQEELLAQLAMMQKTIKEQEGKLKSQEKNFKEKEEQIKKQEREKLEKLKREKIRLERIKKEEEEKLKKQLEETELEKIRLEKLKMEEEEKHRKELEEKERKARVREELLALEMKRIEEERSMEMERERMDLRVKEEKLKEREDRISVLENRSSATNSVMSEDLFDESGFYSNVPGPRRKSSVPDSRRASPCECFLHGFDKCVLYMRVLCSCSESCNFVKQYFSDSAKLEHFAMASTNAQWMSKHAQMIMAGKHVPKTPPHYEDNRTLVRKTPLPTVNLNHLFL